MSFLNRVGIYRHDLSLAEIKMLRYVTLRYVTLRCVALRCVALRCVALRCVALRCVALRCVALCYVNPNCDKDAETLETFLLEIESIRRDVGLKNTSVE